MYEDIFINLNNSDGNFTCNVTEIGGSNITFCGTYDAPCSNFSLPTLTFKLD
jgi:hypothetical protein